MDLTYGLYEAQHHSDDSCDSVRVLRATGPAAHLYQDEDKADDRQQPCRHHEDTMVLKKKLVTSVIIVY